MGMYLHFFNETSEHDEIYHLDNENYRKPWVDEVKKNVRGTRYNVHYNLSIRVSKENLEVSSGGKVFVIEIESDLAWSAGSNFNWITVSPTTGTSGNGTLNITVLAAEEDRTGKVIIKDEMNHMCEITVTQYAYSPPPSVIWIDDFWEDPQELAEYSGYDNFSDYMDDYLEDPYQFGSNKFLFTEETIEYEGNEYYLYEFSGYPGNDENGASHYGLLPIYMTYQSLYNESMEVDNDNRFEVFEYLLNDDGETVYWEKTNDENFVLVKVEE